MRFAKGLGFGVLGFIIYVFGGVVVLLNYYAEYGVDAEIDGSLVIDLVPIWAGITLIGVLIMVGMPVYYWIIEPLILKKNA